MRILFITDPLAHFKIAKDSTYAIMLEAARRGHTLYVCQVSDLVLLKSSVRAAACQLTFADPADAVWYQLGAAETIALHTFDVVLMRKDPPFDIEYITATWLLSQAEKEGANVFNYPEALRNHSEKIAIAEFSEFIPPTLVTHHAAHIRDFYEQYQDIIIKPLYGMGGAGVFRVASDGLNLNAIIETLGQQGRRSLMVQKFIPEISAGDKRVLLIGGQVVPYALARIPAPGEVRGNLAAGATGVVQPLSSDDLNIAKKLAPILWKRGLLIVGLDIIGRYLTEINVTSPTGFREITAQTDCDIAAMTLTALESMSDK